MPLRFNVLVGGTVVRRNRSRSRLPEVDDPEDEQDADYEAPVDSNRGIRQSNSRYQIDEDVSFLNIRNS